MFNCVNIYLSEAASLPPNLRVPNCPLGLKRLILLNSVEESNFMMNLSKIGYFKISKQNNNINF